MTFNRVVQYFEKKNSILNMFFPFHMRYMEIYKSDKAFLLYNNSFNRAKIFIPTEYLIITVYSPLNIGTDIILSKKIDDLRAKWKTCMESDNFTQVNSIIIYKHENKIEGRV